MWKQWVVKFKLKKTQTQRNTTRQLCITNYNQTRLIKLGDSSFKLSDEAFYSFITITYFPFILFFFFVPNHTTWLRLSHTSKKANQHVEWKNSTSHFCYRINSTDQLLLLLLSCYGGDQPLHTQICVYIAEKKSFLSNFFIHPSWYYCLIFKTQKFMQLILIF